MVLSSQYKKSHGHSSKTVSINQKKPEYSITLLVYSTQKTLHIINWQHKDEGR